MAFACAHFCSMGLKSGEYAGRYSKSCPACLISFFVSSRLWNVALSITMTEFDGSLGSKSCSTHPVNTSAFMFTVNKAIVSRVLPSNAPIAFVRPLACQSWVPKHFFPLGA